MDNLSYIEISSFQNDRSVSYRFYEYKAVSRGNISIYRKYKSEYTLHETSIAQSNYRVPSDLHRSPMHRGNSEVHRRSVTVHVRSRLLQERIPRGSPGGGHVTGGRMTDMACRRLWPWTRGFPRAPGVLEREAPNVESWHLLRKLMSSPVRSHSDWSNRFSPSIIRASFSSFFYHALRSSPFYTSFSSLCFFLSSQRNSEVELERSDLEPWSWDGQCNRGGDFSLEKVEEFPTAGVVATKR